MATEPRRSYFWKVLFRVSLLLVAWGCSPPKSEPEVSDDLTAVVGTYASISQSEWTQDLTLNVDGTAELIQTSWWTEWDDSINDVIVSEDSSVYAGRWTLAGDEVTLQLLESRTDPQDVPKTEKLRYKTQLSLAEVGAPKIVSPALVVLDLDQSDEPILASGPMWRSRSPPTAENPAGVTTPLSATDDHSCARGAETPLAMGSSVAGRLEVGDEDCFAIRLSADSSPSRITAWTEGGTDTYGVLYDDDYEIVDEHDDISAENYNFSVSVASRPGTYYVKVRGFDRATSGEYVLKANDHRIAIDTATPISASALAVLCGDETRCDVAAVHEAGADADGQALRVAELRLDGECSFGEGHDERDFWLLPVGLTDQPTLVLSLCNDGYGVHGLGEDDVSFGDNRISHSQYGGSNWRWWSREEYRLSPYHLVSESSGSEHIISGEGSTTWFDYGRLQGAYANRNALGETDAKAGRYVPLLPSSAFGGTEPGTPLGSCASSITEDLQPGFLLYGDSLPEGTRGATLRFAMKGERELILTVVDDQFDGGSVNWIHDDHVEVWALAPDQGLVQWGIGVDGQVHAAHGVPAGLDMVARSVDRENGRMRATWHLRLPWPVDDLTVVYSQAENGRQHRLFATSQFEFGEAETLGSVQDVTSPHTLPVICAKRNGQLDLLPG